MQPSNLKYHDVNAINGLYTNIDKADLREDFALKYRGGRRGEQGVIWRKDFGTIFRLPAGTGDNLPTAMAGFVDGFTMIDPTTGLNHEVVVGVDSSNNTRVWIESSGTTSPVWLEMTARYNGSISAIVHTSPHTVTFGAGLVDINGNAVTLNTNDLAGWLIVNVTVSPKNYGFIKSNDANSVTLDITIDGLTSGGTGLLWDVGNTIYIFKSNDFDSTRLTGGFFYQNGTTPHTRFDAVEAQRKVNMMYGSSAIPPVMNYPLQLKKFEATKFFFTDATTALVTLPAGFYANSGGGLCPFFARNGSQTAPVVSGTTQLVYDKDANAPWLSIGVTYTTVAAGASGIPHHTWLYNYTIITPVYGYQIGDPIFANYFFGDVQTLTTTYAFAMNFGLMNKNITGFMVWCWRWAFEQNLGTATVNNALKNLSFKDFVLAETIYFDKLGSHAATESTGNVRHNFQIESNDHHVTEVLGADSTFEDETSTLFDMLDHAPSTATRELWKPRYAVRSARGQGAIRVINKSDDILLLSNYNGDGDNEDDNFPDVLENNNNDKMKVFLIGHGSLLGLAVNYNRVIAFRQPEFEVFDLVSESQGVVKADLVSPRSILSTDYGVFWAGTANIYMLPADGSSHKPINKSWENKYNGTLMVSDGVTPFVSSTARSSIISGYDPFNRKAWFQILMRKADNSGTEYVMMRYDVLTGEWDERVLGDGSTAVKFFSARSDNSMTLAISNGLLKYPNHAGTHQYLDFVAVDDTITNAVGFPGEFELNIGSIYQIAQQSVLFSAMMEHNGSSADGESWELRFYANRAATPIHTDPYKLLISRGPEYPADEVFMERVGGIQSIIVNAKLNSSDLATIYDSVVNKLSFGFIPVRKMR